MSNFHTSVLAHEVIEGLRVKRGRLYIDATIGGGGHAREIVERGGKVLGIDQDETAVLHIKNGRCTRCLLYTNNYFHRKTSN